MILAKPAKKSKGQNTSDIYLGFGVDKDKLDLMN